MRHRRSTLAVIIATLLLGLFGVAAPVAAAQDAECATTPAKCATVAILASGDATGWVRGPGIDCRYGNGVKSGSCSYRYYVAVAPRSITISAAPDTAYAYACGPGGNCGTLNNPYDELLLLQPGTSYSRSRTFDWMNPQHVTVTLDGTGAGHVESSPFGIACPPTCDKIFGAGLPVTFLATPAEGSTFVKFTTTLGLACTPSQLGTCQLTVGATGSAVTFTFKSNATPPPSQTAPPSSTPRPSQTARPSSTPSPTHAAGSPSLAPSLTPGASDGSGPSPTPVSMPAESAGPGGSADPASSEAPAASAVAVLPGASGLGASIDPAAPATPGATQAPTAASATGEPGMPAWPLPLAVGIVLAFAAGLLVARRAGPRAAPSAGERS